MSTRLFAMAIAALALITWITVSGCEVVDPEALIELDPPNDDPPNDDPPNDDPPNDDPPSELTFQERDGLVAVEAEHYFAVDLRGHPRDWVLTQAGEIPNISPDPDGEHVEDSSGGAYLEILPDTRVTHADPIGPGAFFSAPGQGPTVSYRVNFETTGRYYVWVRAHSTGTEDNGLHLGVDDTWPGSGERIQWTSGKFEWTWANSQRDSCGQTAGCRGSIYVDIDTTGEHIIRFSQREDGFEFDKFLMTTDLDYTPQGMGPEEVTL